MKLSRKFLTALVAFCFTAIAAFAADASPAGTWKWTQAGRQGGQGIERSLVLEYKSGALTGTLKARDSGLASWGRVGGVEEAQGGGGMGSVVLGAGGQVDRPVAQECAEERGAQECEVARAAGMAAEFGVFAPGDVAAVVVGAFHAPMTAAAGEPLARGQRAARERGDKVAGLAAGGASPLVDDLAGDRDDGGGVGKAELRRGDGGERQRAVFAAAVVAVVGRKRGATPWSACAAAACTAGALPLSWMR